MARIINRDERSLYFVPDTDAIDRIEAHRNIMISLEARLRNKVRCGQFSSLLKIRKGFYRIIIA